MHAVSLASRQPTLAIGLNDRWPHVVAACPWVSDWRPGDIDECAFDSAERHLRGECDEEAVLYSMSGGVRRCYLELPGKASGTWEPAKCPTQRTEELQQAAYRARLPRHHLRPLGDLEQTAAVTRARAWADGYEFGAKGLLLVGPTGTGKTQILTSMAYHLLDKGTGSLHYCTAASLLDTLRRFEGDTAAEYRRTVDSTGVLIIDDLGAESVTDWARAVLTDVIDYRYREALTLIVGTNLGRADMKRHLGERIVSRLHEMAEVLVLDGKDRRRAS